VRRGGPDAFQVHQPLRRASRRSPGNPGQLKKWGLGQLTITAVLRDPSFYPDKRWSWHFSGTAVDLRTKGYSAQDVARMVAWLQGRAFNLGTKVDVVDEGDHIHVEVEDWEWRRNYELKTGRRPGVA
jgi:hypothetical protein